MKIFQNIDASHLLSNSDFLNSWDSILKNCSWATIFQSKEFVTTWYSFYKEFKPIIATDWDGIQMTGIFTLTMEYGTIGGAGTNQA